MHSVPAPAPPLFLALTLAWPARPPPADVLSGAALLGHTVRQLDLVDEDVSGLIATHTIQMHQHLDQELNFSTIKKGPAIPPLEPRLPQLGSFAATVRAGGSAWCVVCQAFSSMFARLLAHMLCLPC